MPQSVPCHRLRPADLPRPNHTLLGRPCGLRVSHLWILGPGLNETPVLPAGSSVLCDLGQGQAGADHSGGLRAGTSQVLAPGEKEGGGGTFMPSWEPMPPQAPCGPLTHESPAWACPSLVQLRSLAPSPNPPVWPRGRGFRHLRTRQCNSQGSSAFLAVAERQLRFSQPRPCPPVHSPSHAQ